MEQQTAPKPAVRPATAARPAAAAPTPRQQTPPASGAVQIRGGAWYIKVAERVSKFRQDHPNWSVICEPLAVDEKHALFKAAIMDESGRVISVGHKMVKASDNEDYVEAAETGAVGRALNFLGYDTASLLNKGE